jgi:acetoin utilization protein AcuB
MIISNWMNTEPLKVNPDASMMRAGKILKDADARELSVVDENNVVVGVLTDRDIKEASPSKATTLDVHELYYLLSEIKVGDIMTKDAITLGPDDTVERAAVLMMDKKIGLLPIVDASGKLVGSLDREDVFNVLVSITGVLHGGVQIGVEMPNTPGSLQEALGIISEQNARVMSIMTSYASEGEGKRQVYFRFCQGDEAALVEAFKKKFSVMFSASDEVHPSIEA